MSDDGRVLTRAELYERLHLTDHAAPDKALTRMKKRQGLRLFKLGRNVACRECDLQDFLRARAEAVASN